MKSASALAFVLCLAGASGAHAQAAGYKEYRAELMEKGWKPDASYGLKTAKGQALYKYPEVVCGPQLCFAKWRDGAGAEQKITLVRGTDGGDHHVAP